MKKIFTIIIIPLSAILYSQTFNEVLNISSYYGKTFNEFEKGNNILSKDPDSKFGIESRSYVFTNFNLLISEIDDNELIGKIMILSKDNIDNHETWYNVCKYVDKDPSFKFFSSFASVKDSDINNANIPLSALLTILRETNDLSEFVYYIVYKRKDLYYEFAVVNGSLMINISQKTTSKN